MKSLIIGFGEVGGALYEILKVKHEVWRKDIGPEYIDPDGSTGSEKKTGQVWALHVCLRYSDNFMQTILGYMGAHSPRVVDVCTTVPPGTTRRLGPTAVHSTTRGLHPNLAESLKTFVKHIGGPLSRELVPYYGRAGIQCVAYERPETTELAHILYNAAYGVQLMLADEMQQLCRHYGTDYVETVLGYTATGNRGFEKLDHKGKARMLIWPPGGRIGGHCVVQGAGLIPPEIRGPLMERLARFNDAGKISEGSIPKVSEMPRLDSPPAQGGEAQ
mgnify:CR=1 FL=1